MKNKGSKYYQISKIATTLLNQHNDKIGYSARWLYTHLNMLENNYTAINQENPKFFHSLTKLSQETGISRMQVSRDLKTLQNIGLIEIKVKKTKLSTRKQMHIKIL